MARSRDKLYIEQGIGENDIERAIKRMDLENDPEFIDIMRQNQKDMDEALKSKV